MGRVFISYSHKDSDIVLKVKNFLTSNYILTWFDKNNIDSGERWGLDIETAITSCSVFLAFYSKNYFESQYCNKELDAARRNNRVKIMPICLDDEVKGFNRLNYSEIQYDYDLTTGSLDGLFDELMKRQEIINCKICSDINIKDNLSELLSMLGGIGEPKHYKVLRPLINFLINLAESERNNKFIAKDCSVTALKYAQNVADFKQSRFVLPLESAYSNIEDIQARNAFIRKVLYTIFRHANEIEEKDLDELKFNDLYWAQNGDKRSLPYKIFNEKITEIYKRLKSNISIQEIVYSLYDICNASLFLENYLQGQEKLSYDITSTVIVVAKILYKQRLESGKDAVREVFCNDENCLPEVVSTNTNEPIELTKENALLIGEYGAGSTSYLLNLFSKKAESLYIDLYHIFCNRTFDADVRYITAYILDLYGLNWNDIYCYSSAQENKFTLLLDNFDKLTENVKNSVLKEIRDMKSEVKIIMVSSKTILNAELSFSSNNEEKMFPCTYLIKPLDKTRIIKYISYLLNRDVSNKFEQSVNGKESNGFAQTNNEKNESIIQQLNDLDENANLFAFFNTFTKINILMSLTTGGGVFDIGKINRLESRIKVYQDLFEGKSEFSVPQKVAQMYAGSVVDIRDIIVKMVQRESDILKQLAYEQEDVTQMIDVASSEHDLRFRKYNPGLTHDGEKFNFNNEDIRSYFIAAYIIAETHRIDCKKGRFEKRENDSQCDNPEKYDRYKELEKLLSKVSNNYAVLKYLSEFDIISVISREIVLDILHSPDCETLSLILFKIAQYGNKYNRMFLTKAKFAELPDGFFLGIDNCDIICVPRSVTVIGRSVFANSPTLKTIDMSMAGDGDGVEIKPWAIMNCPCLETVILPKGYQTYCHPLITKCPNLKEFKLDEEHGHFGTLENGKMLVSKDGTTLYASLNSLSGEIKLDEKLTTLKSNCLSYLDNVTAIYIPKNVVEMNTNFSDFCDKLDMFYVDAQNQTFFSDDNGFLYNRESGGTTLFRVPSGRAGEVHIPRNVVKIGSDSISCCSKITKLFVPDTVQEIDNYAFADTYSLTDCYIEGDDLDWGYYVFLSTNAGIQIHIDGMDFDLVEFNNEGYIPQIENGKYEMRRIDIEAFEHDGFEVIKEGNKEKTVSGAVVFRNLSSLNNGQGSSQSNFNILVFGMTEYNMILSLERRNNPDFENLIPAKRLEKLIFDHKADMIVLTRDLPLLKLFNNEIYKNLWILRTSCSSTATTDKLKKIILGEKK